MCNGDHPLFWQLISSTRQPTDFSSNFVAAVTRSETPIQWAHQGACDDAETARRGDGGADRGDCLDVEVEDCEWAAGTEVVRRMLGGDGSG